MRSLTRVNSCQRGLVSEEEVIGFYVDMCNMPVTREEENELGKKLRRRDEELFHPVIETEGDKPGFLRQTPSNFFCV